MSAKRKSRPQPSPRKQRPMCQCGRETTFLPDIDVHICPTELKRVALSEDIVNSLAEKFRQETQSQIDRYHRESDRAMEESNRLLQQAESMVAQLQSGEMPTNRRTLTGIQALSDSGKAALRRSTAAAHAARVLARYQDPAALRRMIESSDMSGPPKNPRSIESIIRELDNMVQDHVLLEDRHDHDD